MDQEIRDQAKPAARSDMARKMQESSVHGDPTDLSGHAPTLVTDEQLASVSGGITINFGD